MLRTSKKSVKGSKAIKREYRKAKDCLRRDDIIQVLYAIGFKNEIKKQELLKKY